MERLVSLGAALLAASSPGAVNIRRGLAYGLGARERLDVYSPREPAPRAPLALFLYGGSWQSGDRSLYRFMGLSLASRGVVTVIPDYRVYPEVAYPDFLRDNARAAAFARRHAADFGASSGTLYLVGHSAGAYNAVMLAADARWLGEAGMDPHADVGGVVGLAGAYDFLPLRDPKLKIIFGPEETRPDTQPINHVGARTPPLRLLAGERDTVVDPGNAVRLAAAVAARGGTASVGLYPGLGHIGLLAAVAGLFRRRAPVLDDIVAFVHGRPAPVVRTGRRVWTAQAAPRGAAS